MTEGETITARPRGLAALSPERRREIARAGGKSSTGGFRAMTHDRLRGVASAGGQQAHINGHTHEWDHEEALQAVACRKWRPVCWKKQEAS